MSFDLHHGDCLEVMAGLPDASVDAVITDPPFGIGFKYGDAAEEINTPEAYGRWLAEWLAECKRVAKPGAFFAVWMAGPYLRHAWEWFGDEVKMFAACKNFVQIRKAAQVTQAFDPVAVWYEPGEMLRPDARVNRNWFVSNTTPQSYDPLAKGHPCPRPLDLCRHFAANFTKPGAVILDPFMGSGTTGKAALLEGRQFIGIERDDKYFAIASERIAAAHEAKAA